MRLIELGDYYFNLEAIGTFCPSKLDKEQTIVFLKGSSALDGGFLVDLPIEDVLQELENARLIEVGIDVLARESSADA